MADSLQITEDARLAVFMLQTWICLAT